MDVEKTVLGVADYVIFALMLLISASIGVYFKFSGGKQRTTEEYLLAGKDMSILPVAFSLMASFLSAITVIGTPAEMYRFGIHLAFLNLGFIFGAIFVAYVFLPVFFEFQSSTAYEYLERRFGRLSRTMSSLAFVIQMILYMSVVLYAPALALSAVTNLSTWISVVSIGVVCTFYCTLGGMKAVLWTDVFQAMLMFIGLFAVLIKGWIDVGGFSVIYNRALAGGRLQLPSTNIDLETRYTMLNVMLQGMVLATSSFGSNQVQIQRMLTVKNITRSRAALFLSLPMGISFHLLNCFAGIIIYAVYYNCDPMTSPEKPISSSDQAVIGPTFDSFILLGCSIKVSLISSMFTGSLCIDISTNTLMPYYMMSALGDYPGLPGLCICGIFSASLSTVSSAVNSLSAVTMEDFVRPFLSARGITQKKAAFFAKAITLAYGAICVMLTFLVARFGNLVQASLIVFGMLAGPVLAVFTLGMLTTRANDKGVVFGMLTSIGFSMWMSFGSSAYGPHPVTLPVSTEGCASMNSSSLSSSIILSSILNNSASFNSLSSHQVEVEVPKMLYNNSADVSIHTSVEENRYIFPLYRVSYMWVAPFSFIIALVLGYFASIAINLWTGQKNEVSRDCLSPVVRWMIPEKEEEKKNGKGISHTIPMTLSNGTDIKEKV